MLLRGVFSGNEQLMGMCNELYDHRQWLWTFLDREDVELTNNGSEHSFSPRGHLAKAVVRNAKRKGKPLRKNRRYA